MAEMTWKEKRIEGVLAAIYGSPLERLAKLATGDIPDLSDESILRAHLPRLPLQRSTEPAKNALCWTDRTFGILYVAAPEVTTVLRWIGPPSQMPRLDYEPGEHSNLQPWMHWARSCRAFDGPGSWSTVCTRADFPFPPNLTADDILIRLILYDDPVEMK